MAVPTAIRPSMLSISLRSLVVGSHGSICTRFSLLAGLVSWVFRGWESRQPSPKAEGGSEGALHDFGTATCRPLPLNFPA